jgi:GH15 family glucan-1,4-alpha-glucosidase
LEPQGLDPQRELARTRDYWTDWAKRCTYHGRYREPVIRSLLTLKALTYRPTGAIVAALYGETLNCLYASRTLGLPEHPMGFRVGLAMVQTLRDLWQEPDEGIWEVRGGRRHFTFSKMMVWVALDRAVCLIDELGSGGEVGLQVLPELRGLRERIHDEVCERSFNPRLGAFTQSYGSETLDASVLLMPHVGFLSANDPRVRSTVAAVERGLMPDGYFLRYAVERGVDGLAGSEGAFLACSFWLADNYAFAGRHQEAEELFDRLLGVRNHLGLLAEEYDPKLRRQIGNFPQGFSHLALITSEHPCHCSSRFSPHATQPIRMPSGCHGDPEFGSAERYEKE